MATLHLHIGTPKTGTTAIQFFCKDNREELAQQGYCFPLFPFEWSEVPQHRNGHFLVSLIREEDGGFISPEKGKIWRDYMDRVAELLRSYPNLILSDESIWNRSSFRGPGVWETLKRESEAQGYEVHIIVYLRRQDQMLSSNWAQKIKTNAGVRAVMTWEEMLARADEMLELDYHRHLGEIAAYFGKDHVTARVYDRKRFRNGSIIPDFLEQIGAPLDGNYRLPKADANPSVAGNALEIKRIINMLPDLQPDLQRMAWTAAVNCSAQEDLKGYTPFQPDELRSFLARYEESNRLLSRDYLDGSEESPFEPPSFEARSVGPEMYESVVRFFGEMLVQQQERIDRVASQSRLSNQLRAQLRRVARGVRRILHISR